MVPSTVHSDGQREGLAEGLIEVRDHWGCKKQRDRQGEKEDTFRVTVRDA
jgi:hypothetical protein